MLDRKGYIYQSKYEGWYSVSDEAFYPKSSVYYALDPATGRKFMVGPPLHARIGTVGLTLQ